MRDVVVVGAGPAGLAAAVYGGVGGARRARPRGERAGRAGRLELADRELPRLSDGHLRPGARGPRARCRPRSSAPSSPSRGRPCASTATAGRTASTWATASRVGAHDRHRDGREVPQARPPEPLARFEGVGVYYGATPSRRSCARGEEVIVVGGGNSAGQAAVFLSRTAARVTCSCAAPGLADTMSRYLIRRIEETPNIDLQTRTQIVALEGDGSLERVTWPRRRPGRSTTHPSATSS